MRHHTDFKQPPTHTRGQPAIYASISRAIRSVAGRKRTPLPCQAWRADSWFYHALPPRILYYHISKTSASLLSRASSIYLSLFTYHGMPQRATGRLGHLYPCAHMTPSHSSRWHVVWHCNAPLADSTLTYLSGIHVSCYSPVLWLPNMASLHYTTHDFLLCGTTPCPACLFSVCMCRAP